MTGARPATNDFLALCSSAIANLQEEGMSDVALDGATSEQELTKRTSKVADFEAAARVSVEASSELPDAELHAPVTSFVEPCNEANALSNKACDPLLCVAAEAKAPRSGKRRHQAELGA